MSFFDGPLTRIALCWTVERRDGAGLALTTFDRAIERDGVRFDPAPGMTPAAIVRRPGLEPGSSEVSGSVSSRALSEEDLALGRWDGAAYRLSACDWDDPETAALSLAGGRLGEVDRRGQEFSADLIGTAAALATPVCPVTSPTCRAELGDDRCRVDLAGRTSVARIVSQDGVTVTVDIAVDERLLFGRLRFTSGENCGLGTTIIGVDGGLLRLRDPMPGSVAVGDRVRLTEGCDKTLAVCAARFANAANFRGEPHLPGNDLLTRYPGA